MHWVWGGLAAVALIAGAGPASAAECGRACLTNVMQRYLAALVRHNPRGLAIAPDVMVKENGRVPRRGGEGAWKTITKVYPGLMFADPATRQVVHAGAVDGENGIASLFVRLKVKGGRIVEAETLYNTSRPSGVFAPANLIEPDLIYDATVPVARRSNRAEMIALVDGYMEAISRHDGSTTKFNYRCDRYASGAKTTNNPRFGPNGSGPCSEGFKGLTGDRVVNRRFPVVDEEKGVVAGMFLIPHSERTPPNTLYVGELFKIVDGKIRSIEEFSVTLPYPPQDVFPR
jgi:hypothetical protein